MNSIWEKLARVFKIKDLRKSILFILAMIVIFRVAAHIQCQPLQTSRFSLFIRTAIPGILRRVLSGVYPGDYLDPLCGADALQCAGDGGDTGKSRFRSLLSAGVLNGIRGADADCRVCDRRQ